MTIGLVTALAKDHKPDDIIAVLYRLGALAKLIEEGHAEKSAIPVSTKTIRTGTIERQPEKQRVAIEVHGDRGQPSCFRSSRLVLG